MKMKVLKIDGLRYLFPDSVTNIDDFIKWIDAQEQKFVLLKHVTEFCENDEYKLESIAPYYIDDLIREEYLNFAQVYRIAEAEVIILSREEYDKKLRTVINKKCVTCANRIDEEEFSLDSYRGNLSLDGECYMYREIDKG